MSLLQVFLHFAFCFFLFAFCFLLFAFCFLLFAYNLMEEDVIATFDLSTMTFTTFILSSVVTFCREH